MSANQMSMSQNVKPENAVSVEVKPLRFFIEAGCSYADICYDSNPDAWGVYWRLQDGTARHIKDHSTEAQARAHEANLNAMIHNTETVCPDCEDVIIPAEKEICDDCAKWYERGNF